MTDSENGEGHSPDSPDNPAGAMRDRAIGSALWLFSGTGLQAALRLIVLTILARLLGPNEFGLAAASLVIIGFFRIFLQTGVRPFVVQRPELSNENIESAFCIALIIGFVFCPVIFFFAPYLAIGMFKMPDLTSILRVVVLLLPLQSFGIVAAGLMEREMRFDWIVRIDLFSYLLGYGVVGVALAFSGFGVWSLVGAYLAQEFLKTCLALKFQPHPKALTFDRGSARELVYFGGGFASARMGNFAALNGDNWVAGRWLGQEALGFYKYAFELTAMIGSLFGQVIDRVLFPAMSRVQHDPARLATAYRRGVGMVALIVFPASSILFVLAPEIIELVLGSDWLAVVPPFQVLSLALIVRATYTISDSLARATGAVYRRAWRQTIYAAAVVGFAFIGKEWGLSGLAIGVTAGVLVNLLLMAHLSRGLVNLRWVDLALIHLGATPSFLLSLGSVYGTAILSRESELPGVLVIASSLFSTGVVLLAALRFAPVLVFGRDGFDSLAALVQFGLARSPALRNSNFVRAILPIDEIER
jgi:O-antigen/teichoic acid export membrane protein